MKLQSALPVVVLRDYVRRFEQRDAQIAAGAVVYPIAARPDQILEFYLAGRYRVRVNTSAAEEQVPHAVIVGPCSYPRAELILGGHLCAFTIHFQPTGFHRLFGIPMPELTDRAWNARAVLGAPISELEDRLSTAATFAARVRVASQFLFASMPITPPRDAVAVVANDFLRRRELPRIDHAAAAAGLGLRQFERRFAEEVGLPPKRYGRIVRFQAALETKLAVPDRLWTEIAQECGFFDQMHMVRDFARFAGDSPGRFLQRLTGMSQPWA